MGAPSLHLQAKYCLSPQESMTHPCFLLPNLVAVLQICFGPGAFLLPSVPLSYLLSLPSEDCKIPVPFHVWARGNPNFCCYTYCLLKSLFTVPYPVLLFCPVELLCLSRCAEAAWPARCTSFNPCVPLQLETDLMESAMVCSLCQAPCPDLKLYLSSCAVASLQDFLFSQVATVILPNSA